MLYSKYMKIDIGRQIADLRETQGMTQEELAKLLKTTQSAIARIESGKQNVSADMLRKLSKALRKNLITLSPGTVNLSVHGGKKLHGTVVTSTSKNGAVGLLCASLLNKKKTVLRRVPRISMFFIATAIVTNSRITITRCPIEFLEIELLKLEKMGFEYTKSKPYYSDNGLTKLVDITTKPSKLIALHEKIHPSIYPGLNIDNLPFFAVIATQATGQTLIHDWVYEKRALYFTELDKLGAETVLADPHRIYITGPTTLRPTELVCPPALRPATILLIAMLGAKGESILRNIYSINRGYENLVERLTALGAEVSYLEEY